MADIKWQDFPPENGFYFVYNNVNSKMEIFEIEIGTDPEVTKFWASCCGDDRPYDSDELEGPYYGPLVIPQKK